MRRCVTFDMWNTLALEVADLLRERRAAELGAVLERVGATDRAMEILRGAWGFNRRCWREGAHTSALDVAEWAVNAYELGALPNLAHDLASALEIMVEPEEMVWADGLLGALDSLRSAGISLGLVSDVGFAKGEATRRLLRVAGVLPFLECEIFSDEVGVCKPRPEIFHAALERLSCAPADWAHVGDLMRNDVAGARALGGTGVRYLEFFDDPEASLYGSAHFMGSLTAFSMADVAELLGGHLTPGCG